jgi:PEP-CTERM motif
MDIFTMKTIRLSIMALALTASFGVSAATDVRDAYAPGPGLTYFLPASATPKDTPYYRYNSHWAALALTPGGDWGWTHGAISGSFASASLNLGAFDVDFVSASTPPGERDRINVFDSGFGWRDVGYLNGTNDAWDYGTIDLTPYLATLTDDINVGLQVFINIDTGDHGWAVTLSKSALEVNGGALPPPNPTNPIPEPETYAMLLAGLGMLGYAGRRRKQKTV